MKDQSFTLRRGPRNFASLMAFLSALDVTKEWVVTIGLAKKERSNQQCRYLNGVAYKLLSDATGYERDDISEYMCMLYFGKKQKRKPGKRFEDVPIRTTTTDESGARAVLSTLEFMDYVAFVQRFGAEHGVFIPDPDQMYFSEKAA